jgi:hypothetical protein
LHSKQIIQLNAKPSIERYGNSTNDRFAPQAADQKMASVRVLPSQFALMRDARARKMALK